MKAIWVLLGLIVLLLNFASAAVPDAVCYNPGGKVDVEDCDAFGKLYCVQGSECIVPVGQSDNKKCSQGTSPVTCDDNDPCTTDACVDGQGCVYTRKVCDDNNPCTTDTCVDGQCVYTPKVCNDNDPCTTDTCVDGQCVHTPKCTAPKTCCDGNCVNLKINVNNCGSCNSKCGDNNPCTTDTCVDGQCVYTPKVCNDNNPCTTDTCVDGQCVYTPIVCTPPNRCYTSACVNGVCVDTARPNIPTRTLCGDVCTNLNTDRNNCGACGHSCPSGYICTTSVTCGGKACCIPKP